MRNKIIAGNWKMNLSMEEGEQLVRNFMEGYSGQKVECSVIFAPPFTHISNIAKLVAAKKGVFVAAQNLHEAASGAFTGEISGEILRSAGCSHVIIGHSERRQYFGETNELLRKKIAAAIRSGLTPIFCTGETLSERETNQTETVIRKQITEGLQGFREEELQNLIIAYEPVWAIGTGKNASPEMAQSAHSFVRLVLSELYNSSFADAIPVLYGGSVNAANASMLFAQPDIDGGLVGGASLKAGEFFAIAGSFPA